MDIEEKDGRQPRPENENPENQDQRGRVPHSGKEERKPAYRATRDGGGYQMEGASRPVAKRRPRIKDSRTADYNRPSYGRPFTERPSYRQPDHYVQEEERPLRGADPEGNERQPYMPSYSQSPEGRPRRPYVPRTGNEGGHFRTPKNNERRPGVPGNNNRPGGKPKKQVKKGARPNMKFNFQKQVKYEEELTDPNEPIRLNRFLANAGVCSRREADTFIQAGVVKVNDEVVKELGTKITRQDQVMFHDQPVRIESKIYILLNKPKNCMTTVDDPQNRRTVMDLVKNACHERIYPVGRLDRNTTGVLLLTNDGNLASKLTHPSFKKKKIYHVWLDKDVAVEDMEKLATGLELEDGEIHADAISYASETDRKQVGVEIHSGRNRIVRRMFEALGYHVTKLDRVYFAGLTKKNLGRGKWRYLNEQEVNALRMGAFE